MDIVKCNNCNIVICELLAFVQNKADVMDEDSILRLCSTAFTTDEITQAKKLLFESVQTTSRKVNRKGEGKNKRDMEDILCVIKETDPDLVPIFVARDLQRLPPVTFDHVDVTRLLRDIIKLQDNVLFIKENYATKEMVLNQIGRPHISTEEFQTESTDIINTSCIDNSMTQRPVAHSLSSDSLARKGACNYDLSLSRPTERLTGETGSGDKRSAVSPARVASRPARIEVSQPGNNSYADAAARAPLASETAGSSTSASNMKICKNDDWVLVQRKRNKNRFTAMTGKADSHYNTFKAANTRIPFYIYNVDMKCQTEDISNYIMSKTGVDVQLEKVNMKFKKDYGGYKFMIPKDKLSIFMDENLWPCGVSFRSLTGAVVTDLESTGIIAQRRLTSGVNASHCRASDAKSEESTRAPGLDKRGTQTTSVMLLSNEII
ncbi:hypothetical protein RR48_02308 [Papilio machaon]|uniref:Uncharacterized protein n=1 Tax=Papilio machaon TaxID=76193 RepID=A0A0N1IGX1_PAPMA|nr:hypothetical protein RR48_02308 [Papilio machaon]